jgi:hypothetical protein
MPKWRMAKIVGKAGQLNQVDVNIVLFEEILAMIQSNRD